MSLIDIVKPLELLNYLKCMVNWDRYKDDAKYLSKYHNIKLVNVSPVKYNGNYRECLDTQMSIEIVESLYQFSDIDLYLILSGDGDFIPVVKKIKESKQKNVIIIALKNSLNSRFFGVADKVITYQELLRFFNF